MKTHKFHIGQKLKNSPNDNFPFFEIISITTLSTTGTVFYRVRYIHDLENELVLHEEDLFPFEEANTTVINENVKVFEEGKNYIFSPDKIQVKEFHRWTNYVVNFNVRVQLRGLGYVTVNHPRYGTKDFPVYPKFCLEVA